MESSIADAALVGYRASHLGFISKFDNWCRLIVDNPKCVIRPIMASAATSSRYRRFNSFDSSCHSFRIEAVRRSGNCISAARLERGCLLGKEEQSSLVVFGRRPASKNFAARKAKYLLEALQETRFIGRRSR